MPFTIAPEFTLPLGSGTDGSPVVLDLTNNPHTLLAGLSGSGKTVLLRHLAKTCVAAGAKTVVIDPNRRGINFRDVAADVVATTRAELKSEVEALLSEISRRLDLLRTFNVSKWQDLPEEVRTAEAARPIVAFVVEYTEAGHQHPLPKRLALDDDSCQEVQAHNAEADRILLNVRTILRTSRYCGIHLVLITRRADLSTVPANVGNQLDNVIMMLRPGFLPSETSIAMAFRPEHRGAAMAAVHAGEGKAAYGDAVLASTTAGVQRLNFPYNE